MTKYLQKRFLLSEEGAENMKKGILFSVLMNISFLLPMALVYFFVKETISIYIKLKMRIRFGCICCWRR